MEIDLVLAPVDGSDESEAATDYAVAVADAYDADLHLLFVVDERVHESMAAGDVAAGAIADHHSEFADAVRQRLVDRDCELQTSTVAGFSQRSLRQSPGSAILDVAADLDADFVVVPREQGSDDPDEAIGRAALYVIEYASQPVLSV